MLPNFALHLLIFFYCFQEIDFRFIMPLPPTRAQMHKGHRHKNNSGGDLSGNDKRKKGQQKSTFRKAYRGNTTEGMDSPV